MKTLFLFLVACCFVWGCKKSNNTPSSSLSAKINGVAFTPDAVTVTPYTGYRIIRGSRNATNETIVIYSADSFGMSLPCIYSPNGVKMDTAVSSSLTRVGISKSENGEFEFITRDSVVITEGKYQAYW